MFPSEILLGGLGDQVLWIMNFNTGNDAIRFLYIRDC